MNLDERIGWLLLGCLIGFVFGYVVRKLQEIKEELDGIDECVKECRQKKARDEQGRMKRPSMRGIALFLVVSLTLFAAVQSQAASNKSNDTSEKIAVLQSGQKQNLDCTTQVLFDAIRALNERTTYSGEQADSNVALVQAQLDLLLRGQDPNLTEAQGQELLNDYIVKVQEFIDLSLKTKDQQVEFPYPTVEDLTRCLADAPNDLNPNPSEGSTPTPSSEASPSEPADSAS